MSLLEPTVYAPHAGTPATHADPGEAIETSAAALRAWAAGQFGPHHLANIARRLDLHRAFGAADDTDPQLLADVETLLRVLRVVRDAPAERHLAARRVA